ncbi:MAG: membrane protein insertase YidC [Bacteroidota bacterium]
MDRNQVIGFLLIGAILVGFSIFNQPSPEELKALKHQRDSIALIEKAVEQVNTKQQQQTAATIAVNDSILGDSATAQRDAALYGSFATAAKGDDAVTTLENEVFKVSISNKGGRIKSVVLKKYKTFYGSPVTLFQGDSTRFGLNFFSQNKTISTSELYFHPIGKSLSVKENQTGTLTMRLDAGPGQYIDYIYTIKGNSYLLDYNINFTGINNLVASNTNYMELDWMQQLKNQEREAKSERLYATMYYQYDDGENEVDYISETKDDKVDLKTKAKWVAMKQHFFTQVLIADKSFESPTTIESFGSASTDLNVVKTMKASFTIPYGHTPNETFAMHFYFGPNHYQTLQKVGYSLQKQIPLGWGILGWVNKYLVIFIFNWLDSFNLNYGIIILILTIAIKLLLIPLTYKAYLSQAKMKVLKPEIEEIQTKNKEEPMKLQQEMMALYKKAGVSPLGGCWPMLLQLPILFAMLRFFPSSIELRQQGFLWAKDLSTYDSILSLPFTIPFYGAHVSLFTLLMTASTLLLTSMNSQSAATNPQMKWMMYLMPVFFMGFLNSYSAGLNYYYFLANVISIGQQYLFRSFVDEDAIHRQIQENKKKPVQKSKFQKRLEDMAKQRGYQAPK